MKEPAARQSRGSYRPFILVLGFLALGLPPPVSSQPIPIGGEFRVNTYTPGDQVKPAISSDAQGNFVVVWGVNPELGPVFPIELYARRYSSSGAALGPPLRFGNGRLLPFPGHRISVSSDADGNFVAVWRESEHIFARRYSSSGAALGGEFRVSTYQGRLLAPAVKSDGDGNFVVVWQSCCNDGSAYGIFGRRYSSSGAAFGGEFRVNTYTTDNQAHPAIGSDGDGNFVFVWQSDSQDGSESGIFARRYSSSGAAFGSEFRVNTFTNSRQAFPAISSDAQGDFVVVWFGAGDGDGDGVFGQRYSSSGAALGGEFLVNTYTVDGQGYPSVSSGAQGDFVVVWQSKLDGNYLIFGQHYDSYGAKRGSEFRVSTYVGFQYSPAVSSDAQGDFVVVWNSSFQDGEDGGIFGQRFAVPTMQPTAAATATAPPTATPTQTATPTLTPTATPTPTPLDLPGGGSASQQITVTERDRAIELTFQVVAPPIPGGCQVSVEVQPPTGQATTFPMTTDLQVQTIDEPQPGVWTITARSGQGCPEFSYYLTVRAVPIVGAVPLGLLAVALGAVAVLRRGKARRLWVRAKSGSLEPS